MKFTSNDVDKLTRTVLSETSGNIDESRAIANVVANRAYQTGKSPAAIATNPRQFNGWMKTINGVPNKAYANTQIPETDPRYQAVKAIVEGTLDGSLPDNTAGATNYYSPAGLKALGLPTPSWAGDATNPIGKQVFGTTAPWRTVDRNAYEQAADFAANPDTLQHLTGAQSADQYDRLVERQASLTNTPLDRMYAAVSSVVGPATTAAIKAGQIAIGGVQSLGELAAAAAAAAGRVATQSAQQQPGNPMPAQPAFQQPAHPPSTGLGAPLGAVERGSLGAPEQDLTQAAVGRLLANSPTGLAAAYQAANPKPDLSTPVGRMYAAAAAAGITPQTHPAHPSSANPNDTGADLSARLSAADRQTPRTQPARPYSQTPASAYGWENGSPGGILGTQNDFGGGAAPSAPASMSPGVSGGGMAGGGGGGWGGPGPQPAHPHTQTPDSAYGRVTMPLGMSAPDMTGFDIGTQLSTPSTYTSVSPQTAMDEANLSAQIAALSQGPAPGAISQAKPGELGYSPPTPQISRPRPTNTLQRVTTPVSLPARPQSPFIGGTSVYNDQNQIVGEVNPWGKVISQLDVAPNSPVFDQNNVQVGTLSPGQGFQAQPLQSQGFLGSLFGGFGGASPVGGYQSSDSKAYGHLNYGTQNYGGNGGSTLGGGDNHRAL